MIEYRYIPSGIVEMHVGYGRPIRLDEPSLRQAIENIRERRDDYATTAAWSAHLSMYEGALEFLMAHANAETA